MRQSRWRRRITGTVAAIGLFLGLAPSLHATVLYEYHSFCVQDCANVGLEPGDAVGGFIGFSDAAVANGGAFSPSDVDYFDVRFGIFDFTLPSLGLAFATFTGPQREAFSFAFITNAPGDSPGYAFAQTSWIAGATVDSAAIGGPGSLRLVVPEPASGILAATALLLAAAARRRSRRQRSA